MKYINKLFNNLKIHEKLYTYSLYFVYLLYFLSFFITSEYNKYIEIIRLFLKYYVILFLLIRFNPLVNIHCNHFDKIIIFQSAIFLLLTTNIKNYL
jgi:hypothetical protein